MEGDHLLVIGLGGTGCRIGAILRERWRGNAQRSVLTIDTDSGSQVPPPDHVSIGGFTLAEAIPRLDLSSWYPDDVALLRSRNLNIYSGASAMPVVGKAAFGRNQAKVQNALSSKLLSFQNRPVRVVIVGSLAGGTGGGIAADLMAMVHGLTGQHRIVEIAGFFMDSGIFRQALAGHSLSRVFADNETWALRSIQSFQGGDRWRYTPLFSVSTRATDPEEAAAEFANTIEERWLEADLAERDRLVRSGEEDGILILGMSGGERVEPTLLWAPVDYLPDLSSSRLLPPEAVPMAPVPLHGSRWERILQEFEHFINRRDLPEAELQAFLESNPEILQGIDYDRLEPHVYLMDEREGVFVPDFMMVPFDSDLADIVELKRPRDPIVVRHGRHAKLSAVVAGAVAQAIDYHDYFEVPEHRERVRQKYGFTAYRPKVTVVVGLLKSELDDLVFRRVLSRHATVEVVPYDRLLQRARRTLLRV